MDKTTVTQIKEQALRITEYAAISGKLRKIAKTIIGPSQKELLAIAQDLEKFPESFFRSTLFKAYRIYLENDKCSDLQLSQKLNVSLTTVKQIKVALIQGGVKFENRKTTKRQEKSSVNLPFHQHGKGPESTNEQRSNDERISDAIALVEQAVKNIKETTNWDSLNVRAKIKLIKEETLKLRGTAISSQTLYRPWIRDLW